MIERSVPTRERRRTRQREEIGKVALDLFAQRGYDEVTVEEIADAADVSPRTFFRYFSSKQATLWPIHEDQLETFREALWAGEGDEPLFDSISRALTQAAGFYDQDYAGLVRRTSIMLQSPSLRAYFHELQQPWAEEIAALAADRLGLEEDALGPRVIGLASVAAIQAAIQSWIRSDGQESYAQLTAEALHVVKDMATYATRGA
jgi:AcrR family transcriptional regulator